MAHTWKVFRYHILGTLSDRYENFTSDWLWIEVCQTAVLNKQQNTAIALQAVMQMAERPNGFQGNDV